MQGPSEKEFFAAATELSLTLVADPSTHDVLISLNPPKEPSNDSKPPGKRAPVDICCVIDVSMSMDSELKASLQEDKAAEGTGLSTLDVVKHAIRTIVATMLPDDRIALVTFSNEAKVKVGFTPMTTDGKTTIVQAVNNLCTTGSTNLWAGLKTGMDVLNGIASISTSGVTGGPMPSIRFQHLFLLTDGQPNQNPPEGIITALQSYINSHPLKFSVHTFGFGYSLDSQLLLQISRFGDGAFGFIPDASSLGAVFIHAVANIYSVWADWVEIKIKHIADNNSDWKVDNLEVLGGYETILDPQSIKVKVGVLQYGQTRDFVVRMNNYPRLVASSDSPALSVTVNYRPWTHISQQDPLSCSQCFTQGVIAGGASEPDLMKLKHHLQRFSFIRVVNDIFPISPPPPSTTPSSAALSSTALSSKPLPRSKPVPCWPLSFRFTKSAKKPKVTSRPPPPSTQTAGWDLPSRMSRAIEDFNSILSSLRSPSLSTYTCASALAEDISGEVLLALSKKETFHRWGTHYLPSLARSHLLQQCTTYRDPGLQVYGANSPIFVSSRDALDKAFDNLPPPEPSIKHTKPIPWQPPQSMSDVFASRSGPCFDGACKIVLASGQEVPVQELRRDMCVQTPKGARTVVAVIETRIESGQQLLCTLPGGLKITPWHPIKRTSNTGEHWVFPSSQAKPRLQSCDAVYSLLLEPDADPTAHAVYVQGMLCVTLGHGLTCGGPNATEADARIHEFLGDYERILESLATFPEAVLDGIFRVKGVLRSQPSGTICGFIPNYDRGERVLTDGWVTYSTLVA